MHAHDDDPAPRFRLFWEGSKLDAARMPRFAHGIEEEDRTPPRAARLFYAPAGRPLPTPTDPIAACMRSRRSRRSFGDRPITEAQLGSLCHPLRDTEHGLRAVPSAGARYPVELFVMLFHAEGPLAGHVVHYETDAHALTPIRPCPPWNEVAPAVGLDVEGEPAALFVFAIVAERTLRRYGERGGRFVLVETGACAYAIELRAAHEGLAGVLAGGLHDERLRAWLGLDASPVEVALGFAVGAPRPP